MTVRFSTMLLCAILAGCSGSGDRPRPLLGSWGGENAGLALGTAGGWLDLDCAWATIDAPLVLDRHRRFDLQGRHVVQQGPPPHGVEAMPESRPARYEGWIEDDLMTLRVTVAGEATTGPFFLRRDRRPSFTRYCY